MCGIVGATGNHGGWIGRALAAIRHRGPDRQASISCVDVQLAHARLAVIDLSPDADQPMLSDDRTMAVVFNGELYNFEEEKRHLESLGHRFRTRSDTEVLLHLYGRYGEACLERMRGMFAFAIWDFRERRLFVARDRLGEKPLYYHQLGDGHLAFASEIKALLKLPDFRRDVDPIALDQYLTYLYVPPPRTIFRGISQLRPGECLSWQDGRFRQRVYWTVPLPSSTESAAEVAQEARRLFDRSVQRTLVADVPVGVFLSGGIDSSAIVATAARFSPRLKTFTVTFGAEGARYDERASARTVAATFGTEHREICVSGRSTELLSTVVRHFDQPFGNPTALLTYEVSRLTRQHVTVVLGGDGGDEVFGGYPRYRGIRLAQAYRRLPVSLRRVAAAASCLMPESTSGRHTLRRAKEFLAGGAQSLEEMYLGWIGYFDRRLKAVLYVDSFRAQLPDGGAESILYGALEHTSSDFVDRAIRCDLLTFLPFNVLEYGDKMSMAHGLELRLPFLDADLVSLMAAVPHTVKMTGGVSKALLRTMMADRLPAATIGRRKMGFNPPMGVWINRELEGVLDNYLSDRQVQLRAYFQPGVIAHMRQMHRRRRRDFSLHLWALIVLEEWHRQYIG